MATVIDSYFIQHKELSNFLLNSKEISLRSDVDRRFTKELVLACASYFEDRIVTILSDHCETVLGSDAKIFSLLRIKALERQYHTYFSWKDDNANRFFSHFGDAIKKQYKTDKAQSEDLKESEKAFMILGRMRNVLVHSNYASAPMDKTHDEVYELFTNAMGFLAYVETLFSRTSESG